MSDPMTTTTSEICWSVINITLFFTYFTGVQIIRDRGLVQSPVIIIIGVHFLILIEVLASARHLVYSGQTQQTYNFSFVRSGVCGAVSSQTSAPC